MIIYREIDINGDLTGDQNAFCSNCDIPAKFNNQKKYECYNNEGNWPCLEDSFTNDNSVWKDCLYCDTCNKRLFELIFDRNTCLIHVFFKT